MFVSNRTDDYPLLVGAKANYSIFEWYFLAVGFKNDFKFQPPYWIIIYIAWMVCWKLWWIRKCNSNCIVNTPSRGNYRLELALFENI